jgi:hypothetical protein
MTNTQESILRHTFIHQIPKSISDKVNLSLEKDGKHQGNGKQFGKHGQGGFYH